MSDTLLGLVEVFAIVFAVRVLGRWEDQRQQRRLRQILEEWRELNKDRGPK